MWIVYERFVVETQVKKFLRKLTKENRFIVLIILLIVYMNNREIIHADSCAKM
jgi:hypothetical protein